MTTITIYKSNTDNYKGFSCKGHAGYARFGKDIVCAAISVLTINTINSIDELTQNTLQVEADERTGYIVCKFSEELDLQGKLLMDSMVLGLKNIVNDYGKKYLRLTFEEV